MFELVSFFSLILYVCVILHNLLFLVSLVVIDKAGRRVLLLASGAVMFLSLSVIGAYFYVIDKIDPSVEDYLSWLPLGNFDLMPKHLVGLMTSK